MLDILLQNQEVQMMNLPEKPPLPIRHHTNVSRSSFTGILKSIPKQHEANYYYFM